MTLLETIRIIENVAIAQPSVKTIVENDIFKLNEHPEAKYGVFAFVQGQHGGSVDSDLFTYRFSFFYVDRLRHDKKNQIEVQSVGIETINNIMQRLSDLGIESGSYTIQPFNQRFADECAGVFCTVDLETIRGSFCSEVDGHYNKDYNRDFLIL